MSETSGFDQFDAEDSRRLTGARIFADPDLPNWPALVELDFDEFTVFVCLEPEFDTVLCTRRLPESYRQVYTAMMPALFWESFVGWTLTDAWQMRNDRGYLDAIQLRFRERPDGGAYRYVQLWSICSSLRLLELEVIRRDPPRNTPAS